MTGEIDLRTRIGEIYRADSRRVLATLIRLLGDFDAAEEALHDAFVAAVEGWEKEGIPMNPVSWLISAGRFKAIDRRRRSSLFRKKSDEIAREHPGASSQPVEADDSAIGDDRLRLIFTCCHPALNRDAQIALTLRTVGGLTTEEIARAFLLPAPTLAQRIVRAKNKIRDARIPYEIPETRDLPERMDAALKVLYLIFNEGYSASFGESLTRADLCAEAIRLARLLADLSGETEARGLLALMLLHDARRAARVTADGEIVLLEDQDRALWNEVQIAEGSMHLSKAFHTGRAGAYVFQAAIAAVHAEAASAAETDWHQIAALYQVLLRVHPTPVVELNHAVAVAMRDGPAAGLMLVEGILARGELASYQYAHSARADLLRRLGRFPEALVAYEQALELSTQDIDSRFLRRRISEVGGRTSDVGRRSSEVSSP